jgi:ferrous iron transport protein A
MRLSLSMSDTPTTPAAPQSLADLAPGESGVLSAIDLPEADAQRLMELGFLPGSVIVAARNAPGGDPRVYRVEGTEFALRGDTARRLRLDGASASVARAAEAGL